MGKNDHSETLTNFLDDFLKSHNIKIEDITEIYVGSGKRCGAHASETGGKTGKKGDQTGDEISVKRTIGGTPESRREIHELFIIGENR